jgi:AcrR family transcriptional regulator
MAKRAEYLGPERRRPLVLEAALEIFAGGGFADASMQAIADRAGVSKAVLYDCFPGGKQEIYYALLERGEHTFMEHMLGVLQRTENLPVDESLRIGLRAFLEYAEIHPHSFRVIFGDAGTRDPEVARRAERTREQVVAAIRQRTRDIMQANDRAPSATIVRGYTSDVAVGEEIAKWILRDPNAPREAIIDAVVNWFMRGFDQLIPNGSRRPELVRD